LRLDLGIVRFPDDVQRRQSFRTPTRTTHDWQPINGSTTPEALMPAREPQEVADLAVGIGTKKTHRRWDKVLVSSFLGGAYIAFGGLVAITVSSGLDPAIWGTLPTLFTGIA
jgi:hypothetical protein